MEKEDLIAGDFVFPAMTILQGLPSAAPLPRPHTKGHVNRVHVGKTVASNRFHDVLGRLVPGGWEIFVVV